MNNTTKFHTMVQEALDNSSQDINVFGLLNIGAEEGLKKAQKDFDMAIIMTGSSRMMKEFREKGVAKPLWFKLGQWRRIKLKIKRKAIKQFIYSYIKPDDITYQMARDYLGRK